MGGLEIRYLIKAFILISLSLLGFILCLWPAIGSRDEQEESLITYELTKKVQRSGKVSLQRLTEL